MSAKATGYLELNISGFDQALKTAKNLMATFAAGFAAYKIGDTFKEGVKDALEFGKSMNSVSRSMGNIGAGNLLLVQKALESTGQGAEEAQGHIADFIKQGRSINTMFGGAENYAKAIQNSAKSYGEQAEILNRSAAKMQTIWNSIEAVVAKSRTFFLAMSEQFMRPLQLAIEKLQSIDLAGIGERFGKAISDAALTLYGIFRNGDITEVLKLGITIAFQDGVNYLVGGLNFAASKFAEVLLNGFDNLVKFLQAAFKAISSDTFLDGMLYAIARFNAELLRGINYAAKVFEASMTMIVIKQINMLRGMVGTEKIQTSFSDQLAKSKGIGSDTISKLDQTAQFFKDRSFDPLNKLIDNFTNFKPVDQFQKADIFNTSEDQARLQEIIANGFRVGAKEGDAALKNSPNAANPNLITNFSGGSAKVIADSLAKVGGGGNFIKVGMTLQERTAMDQLRAARESNEIQKVIAKNTAAKPNSTTMK